MFQTKQTKANQNAMLKPEPEPKLTTVITTATQNQT